MEVEIGEVGNYYGCLTVKKENGKFYWCVENWDGFHWDEIPEYLYEALMKFERERVEAQDERGN